MHYESSIATNEYFLFAGVTARELCHYFFSPDVRMEWETTVEQASVIEKISNDTLLFLQLHKRVWPAAQRDACFWSHMRKVESDGIDDIHDTWVSDHEILYGSKLRALGKDSA